MKKLITAAAIILSMLAASACGGDNPGTGEQANPTPIPIEVPLQANPQDNTAQAQEPERPQRMDFLLTPTVQPAATPRPTRTSRPAGTDETSNSGQGAGTQDAETLSPEDLVPDNPQLTDQILLQDIYGQMDLAEFALDPDRPITLPERHTRQSNYERNAVRPIKSEFSMGETARHPYLFLFPGLRHEVEAELARDDQRDRIEYDPYNPTVHPTIRGDNSRKRREEVLFPAYDPATTFIYFPWFEPISLQRGDWETLPVWATGEPFDPPDMSNAALYQVYGEHWFGTNSTRGVLSKTVAEVLEEATYPAVHSHPLIWRDKKKYSPSKHEAKREWKEKEWKLDSYLRTTIQGVNGLPISRSDLVAFDGTFEKPARYKTPYPYETPRIEWEILHPKLPIIRVTSHVNTILPLAVPGTPDQELTGTLYSVSFVFSLQNRWASFTDPNRHLVRTQDSMVSRNSKRVGAPTYSRYGVSNGAADPEIHAQHYPNYWHNSDYMQHRIIGPVVVTVHHSDVLQPGTYSAIPRITGWEAPGPVLDDKHVTRPSGYNSSVLEYNIFPLPGKANPGWPLPGHVLTNDRTHPGTDVWREAGLDGYDW